MAKTQQNGVDLPHPDLLAAVVLHTLVSKAGERMTASHVAVACEREPSDPADMDEIEAALEILIEDGLAGCGEELFWPTRPAIRASELSF